MATLLSKPRKTVHTVKGQIVIWVHCEYVLHTIMYYPELYGIAAARF